MRFCFLISIFNSNCLAKENLQNKGCPRRGLEDLRRLSRYPFYWREKIRGREEAPYLSLFFFFHNWNASQSMGPFLRGLLFCWWNGFGPNVRLGACFFADALTMGYNESPTLVKTINARINWSRTHIWVYGNWSGLTQIREETSEGNRGSYCNCMNYMWLKIGRMIPILETWLCGVVLEAVVII